LAVVIVIRLQVTGLLDVTANEVTGLCYTTELDGVLEVGCSDHRMKPFILELA